MKQVALRVGQNVMTTLVLICLIAYCAVLVFLGLPLLVWMAIWMLLK